MGGMIAAGKQEKPVQIVLHSLQHIKSATNSNEAEGTSGNQMESKGALK
jgi:hypothetical protein